MAKELGVSRLPVREALRELASEGWVSLERDVGARVTALDPNELLEIFLLREAIEPMLVAQATRIVSEPKMEAIEALNRESEPLVDDAMAYVEVDRNMHMEIFEAARMPRAYAMVRSLWETADRYRRAYSILPHRIEISVVEHRMILEAMRRRAAEDAGELHGVHVRRTRLTLAEHPELFPKGAP